MATDVLEPVETPAPLIPISIIKALVAIQKVLEPITKTAENDAFNSSYTPLDVVTPIAHKLLAKHKIMVMQSPIVGPDGHPWLETIFAHEDGSTFVRSTRMATEKLTPQSHGAAITYYRRFMLMSMLGLTAKDEDDDGNKASGVFLGPTEEQLERIKSLLTNLRYPPKQIAADVFKIKTRDHAALAILNYEKIVAMKVRDVEAKDEATKIEVSSTETSTILDDGSPAGTLRQRLDAQRLASPSYENKVIKIATGKPFFANLKKEEDFKALDQFLIGLESGVHHLEPEFYAPRDEPITVEVAIA